MSRTEREDEHRKWHRKESGFNRRRTRRLERHNAEALLRHDRYDDVDTRLVKGTEGWETH
jgi:hypothetical protein